MQQKRQDKHTHLTALFRAYVGKPVPDSEWQWQQLGLMQAHNSL